MKKNKKLLDLIGAGCGVFLLIVLLVSIISSAIASAPPKGAVTLTGTAPGRNADVSVEVVTDGSKLAGITVTSHEETEGIGTMAVEQLPAAIVEANSLAVDNVSGATISSEAIKAAVADALTQGGFDPVALGYVAAAPVEESVPVPVVEEVEEPAEAPVPVEVSAEAQTLTGSGMGIDGPVVVQITADAERIYDVQVTEQNETVGIGSVAVEKLPAAIVRANSIAIDGISGATVTSTAIKDGIREALASGGIDAAYFEELHETAAAAPVEKDEVTLDYDVVVVGAGGAGLTAAVRATQEGARVLVVEKMPLVGGNSLRAEGGMNAADTKVQAELGLTDSTVGNFVADTLRLGHDLANPDLVRTLAENSAEAVDWLDSIGAPLTKVAATGGTEHKYLHKPEDGRPVGSYLVEKLSNYADQLGIEIMLNTKATEILMSGERACGIKAEGEEHDYIINAKAVVIATGGFGSNFELMASYDPSLADAVTTNHAGAQGDGIMMAKAVGADTVDMEQIQLHPTVIQQNGLLVSESVRSHGAVLVNAEGKRFVNDMAGRDVVSQAELKQPGAYAYIVFDQGLVDEVALTRKFIDGGYALTGETYEELAQAMGLEGDAVANFVETMENWNAYVEAGEDKDFGRSAVSMIDISTAPYYAIKIAPGIHHTMGGIKIDTEAQVINTEGEVIAGLFAAGETTGGIHGGNRVGGNAVCDFIVFGRIAGSSAANYAAAIAPAEFSSQAATLTGSGSGIGGPVVVQITADAEHIYDVQVTEQNETVGIGSVAVEKLPAAIVEANSLAVDNISGASITSGAIKDGIRKALASGGIDAAYFEELHEAEAPAEEVEAPAEETADEAAAEVAEAPAEEAAPAAEAQTLTGSGSGIGGPVTVQITADAEHIYDVQVTEQNETVGIGSVAVDKLPAAIVEANSLAVDGIAGASITSGAIKDGVRKALASGGIDAAYFEELHEAEAPAEEEVTAEAPAEETADEAAAEAAAPAEEAAEPAAEAQTLTGSGSGIGGPVTVQITADAEHIYDVQVTEQNETVGIGSVAVDKLPAAIVEANSLAVDGIAGASITSGAIKDGIRKALASGGIDAAYFEELHEAEAAAETEASAETETEAEPEALSYEADVVVIGAGGAGMSAAITASDAGMKVIVVESQPMVGGNSVRSTGGMNAAPTEWREMNEFGESAGVESTLAKAEKYPDNARIQELAAIVAGQWAEYQAEPEGYFDTVELFQLDTLIGGGGLNDPDLVRTLAERSTDAIAWLDSLDPAVILHNVAQFGGASVKRIHRPVDENGKTLSVGAYVVPLLQQNLEKRGVEVLLETTATEILREDDGPVTGIVCKTADGGSVTISARAVVIASGGFGANNDMIASVRPELDGFITTNAPGVQGQGIMMAQAVGADTVDLEQIQLHPTVHVEGTAAVLITEGLRGDGAILVNREGERFYDEVSTRDKVSAAEFEQTGGYAWLIVDSRMSDASNVIQGYINKGYAVTGETYEELAEAIGAPADVLAATMEKWNACVEAKEDADFGRVSFASPLDQAPYYAIKVQPGVHHTMGGIKINSEAQVIDTEGHAIPGLYAAGETTGGVHGNNRLGGNAVADFVIFGRIAGTSAAAYAGDVIPAEAPADEAAEAPAEEEGGLVDGEYTAEAESLLNFENVSVTIVVEGGKIVSVDVDTSSQSADYGAAAEPQFEEQILDAQGGPIDGVSGATLTSMAVKEAYADVLGQAA